MSIKELFSTDDVKDKFWHCNLGSLEVDNNYQDTETYKLIKWVMENHTGKLKKVTWGDILKLVKEKVHGLENKLQSLIRISLLFTSCYTQKPETPLL